MVAFVAAVDIYFGEDLLVVTTVRRPGGGWFSYQMKGPLSKSVSDAELGGIIREALEESESGPVLDKGFEFWKVVGYRNFAAFSKKYNSLDIVQLETNYRIMLWTREGRGYTPCRHPEAVIELSLDASSQQIGQAVRLLFSHMEVES